MRNTDFMSDRDMQDIRDAGRGHLIDGESVLDKADRERKRQREEGAEQGDGSAQEKAE